VVGVLTEQLQRLSNRARFIAMVVDGTLIISRRPKRDIVTDLERLKFARFPKGTTTSLWGV